MCLDCHIGFRVFGVRTAKESRRGLNITETPRRLNCETFNARTQSCAVMRTQHAKHDHLILVATSDELKSFSHQLFMITQIHPRAQIET